MSNFEKNMLEFEKSLEESVNNDIKFLEETSEMVENLPDGEEKNLWLNVIDIVVNNIKNHKEDLIKLKNIRNEA